MLLNIGYKILDFLTFLQLFGSADLIGKYLSHFPTYITAVDCKFIYLPLVFLFVGTHTG